MAPERKSKGKSKSQARGLRVLAGGRGGPRPGAGRPPERPGPRGIPWATVRRYARLGADRDLIARALGIQGEQLRDPEVLARLQEEVARGEALHQVDLLEDVQRLRRGGKGKVNAVLASLKQSLGWARPDGGRGKDDGRPDNSAAVAEIQRMLARFRAPR